MSPAACSPAVLGDVSFALLPLIIAMSLSFGFGFRLRLDGKRDADVQKGKRGLRYIAFAWTLCLFAIIFDNAPNKAPGALYSTKAILGIWLAFVPLFILAKDNGWLCPPNARCWSCRRCCGAEDVCRAFSNFGEYTMVLLGTAGVPVACLFSCIACHDMENELAHWIIMVGFLIEAGLLLLWSGPSRSREPDVLQVIEGWMWLCFGLIFLVFFTASTEGGLLYAPFHGGQSAPDWKQDQRHILMSMLFLAIGGLAVMLAALGVKSGMPMALLFGTLFASFQVQSASCGFAKSLQQGTGLLCLLLGVLRYSQKFLEASLIAALMAGTYLSSSLCAATFGDNWFDSVAFSILLIVTWTGWWAFTAWQFRGYWYEIIPEHTDPSVSEPSRYAYNTGRYSVVSEDEGDLEMADVPVQDPFTGAPPKVWNPNASSTTTSTLSAPLNPAALSAQRVRPKSVVPTEAERKAWTDFAQVPVSQRQVYVGSHQFTAENDDELNIEVGETVTLVHVIDADWIIAMSEHGSIGLVPLSFLTPKNNGVASGTSNFSSEGFGEPFLGAAEFGGEEKAP